MDEIMINELVYNDGEIVLNVSVESDSVWISTENIGYLFNVKRPAIVKHISNIYKDFELEQDSTCSILEQVAKDGKIRKINYYNLDMIISIGYRVNSKKATKFRQWATQVLKEYITNGYAINTHKITELRLSNLEEDITKIKSMLKQNVLEIKQGIFFNGEIFDAYVFISSLIKEAKSSIILIDNYIDEQIFTLLSKNNKVNITIYTKNNTKELMLDITKLSKQYNKIELKFTNKFHDRFLIIDNVVYHFGASLKDLGNKTFAFNKMAISASDILKFI